MPAGVFGPGGPGHALALTSAAGVTKVGALPPDGALPRRLGYYHPAGLPLRSVRLRHRLIRAVFADEAAQTGLSCSRPDLEHVPIPIPRRDPADRYSRSGPAERGLRREMSGSAPSLSICRGCRTRFRYGPRSCSLHGGFRRPAQPKGSPPPAGACYRAFGHLPGRDSHPLAWSSFQDAPPADRRSVGDEYHDVGRVLSVPCPGGRC